MSGCLLSDPEALQLSDDDLGRLVFTTWLAFQAEKIGIPVSDFSPEMVSSLLAESADIDSPSVKNAALESMFRKLGAADFAAAGRMWREQLIAEALRMRSEKHAKTGLRVRKPFRAANAERHATAEDNNAELQRMANAKWAEPQHKDKSASAIAELIDPEHSETTRRKIKKPQR